MPTTLRRRVRRSLCTAVLLATAACGSSGGAETQTAGAPGAAESAQGAFPVTIEHVFGATTIEAEPERIVVLGVTDADAVLALGKVPVANTGFVFTAETRGFGPWAAPLVEGEDVTFLESDSEPNVEQVAALAPDLIIGISAGFDEDLYAQLSGIAPVIARPAGTAAYTVSRDDATRTIALALGQVERGEELIAAADDAFAEAVAANPEFEGKTATAALPFDGQYGAFLPGDARGQVLDQLGFVLPAAIAELATGDSFFVPVSQEQVNLLDGDVLILLTDEASQPQVDADPVLAQLPVVTSGGLIQPDLEVRGAMTYNTVLSVPFAIDGLVPLLQDALSTGAP